MLLIALTGFILEESAVRKQILDQITAQFGAETAQFIQNLVSTTSGSGLGGGMTALGAITLIFGAIGVFSQLRSSLNRIWKVRPVPPSDFIESLQKNLLNRAVSFTIVLILGALMAASLLASAAVGSLDEILGRSILFSNTFLESINFLVTLLAITIFFAVIFRILPDVEIAWKDTWLGAAFTALLFMIGKTLLGIYLGNGGVGSGFGAAGSLVLVLVFIYYAAQIFFFGAVFTRIYAERYGSRILPADDALPRIEIQPSLSEGVAEGSKRPPDAHKPVDPEQEPSPPVPQVDQPVPRNLVLLGIAIAGSFLAGYLARWFKSISKNDDQ